MSSPPGDDFDAAAAADLLEELASAVRAGRLAGLLKGEGLTRHTVEELLWPESARRLKTILADHLFPECDHRAHAHRFNGEAVSPGNEFVDGNGQDGKLLVFRTRERHGS